MKIRQAIDILAEIRFVIDDLDLCSPLGRHFLINQEFSTDKKALEEQFSLIGQSILLLNDKQNAKTFDSIRHKLSQLRDISGTFQNLSADCVLSDIELFEIKNLALICEDIRGLISTFQLLSLPDLSTVIEILDPDKSRIGTFYIYDSYCPQLAILRKQMKACTGEIPPALYQQATEMEDSVRSDLSQKLQKHRLSLEQSLRLLANLDILIAKAGQAIALHFCRPSITGAKNSYTALFNPMVQSVLSEKGKQFQPIDVDFGKFPTLITGINMGGKTVLLRSLALAQYLCQFGFYVPASSAEIVLVNQVMLCFNDEQNPLQGLSSFASELLQVNKILDAIKTEQQLLILIDELARTTNPTEGKAIVAAVLEMLAEKKVAAFITTHYDVENIHCRRLRVRGFNDKKNLQGSKLEQCIDYSLVEEDKHTAPREAMRIAELLGANKELIERAKKIMNDNTL